MTNIGTIILLIVCVGMGYVLEPMFFTETKKTKKNPVAEAPVDSSGNPVAANPADPVPGAPEPPEPAIQVDLSKITPEDFPAKVELKVDYTISDSNSGVTMQLKKGTKVKPVRVEGADLIIQPVGLPIESKIAVDNTNFKELAVPRMLERLQNAVANKDPEPTPPVTPVTPEPTPPTPIPAVVPPTPPTPPAPAPTPAATKLDEAAIVTLLKSDVQAGKVTEFKANQVTAWKAGEELEFDGDTYQTGRVTFKAETILGVQEHEAIALIEDGKVYKWMWAKTKLEMR